MKTPDIRFGRRISGRPIEAVLVLLCLMLPSYSQTEPTEGPLSLRQAEQRALGANPQLRAARHREDSATAQIAGARSGLLPQLRFSETFQQSNNPIFVFGSRLQQNRFGPQNFELDSLNNPGSFSNFRSAVELSLPLFNRLQTYSGIEKARLGKQQAESISEMERQRLRLEVIQSYFGVLLARSRKEVAEDAVRSADAEVKRIRDLVEQGLLVSSDLLAMRVQRAEFVQQQIEAEGALQIAFAALNTAMAEPLTQRFQLIDALTDRTFPAVAETELTAVALRNRPDYRARQIEVAARRQDLRASRGRLLPDLNLFAELGHSGADLNQGSADFAVGARLRFDIIDFERPAANQQNQAELEAAQALQQQAANRIRLEVVQFVQNYRAAEKRRNVAAAAIQEAEETLRIIHDRHQEGLTTITEVLRAQTALLRARLNLLQARYDYYLGYARTLLAAGQLSDVSAFSP